MTQNDQWCFWYEGWEYLARLVGGEMQVRRAVDGRPWITGTRELISSALSQRPRLY